MYKIEVTLSQTLHKTVIVEVEHEWEAVQEAKNQMGAYIENPDDWDDFDERECTILEETEVEENE